jgi:diadenylate cyclase
LLLDFFQNMTWRSTADIVLVALLFYQIISMLKGTRAAQILVGLLVIFFAYLISSVLQFETLNWIISKFYSSFIIVVIVLFQDDIRRLLTRFGRGPFVSGIDEREGAQVIEQVITAAGTLSHDRIGALIVFERGVGLDKLYDRSVPLEAIVTEQLLFSIFHTFSPLHDGAVIVQKNRLACASAHLPLSKSSVLSRKLGTRHSAALGISEETDAVVLVVSEETGAVSVAYNGRLEKQSNMESARETLTSLLLPLKEGSRKRSRFGRVAQEEFPTGEDSESAISGTQKMGTLETSSRVLARSNQTTASLSEHGELTESETESLILEDVRKLTKLGAEDKFNPPVLPAPPPRDVSIAGISISPPLNDDTKPEGKS